MKKFVFFLLLLACLAIAAAMAYRAAAPEIVVVNVSPLTIEEVVVLLPSSRVVFGTLKPGAQSTIYYSLSQADGTYSYSVRFSGEKALTGSCGHVTGAEFGKRLELDVAGPAEVVCRESSKVF